MKYQGNQVFTHKQSDKIGVLITNLGTPEAPTKRALRSYLKQFLSDPRVVEVPRLLWWFILNLVILNLRPKRSAKAYRSVWTEQGSPLMVHTQQQTKALQQQLSKTLGEQVIVDYAMRYGKPDIQGKLSQLQNRGVRKLLVLPLYPQYSASTSGSTFDAIAASFIGSRWLPDFRFVSHYHDHPAYIQALADKVETHWQQHGRADKLIFSYHGVPKRYLLNGDPYHCECLKTTRLVAERLGLQREQYLVCFQSRFGREEWLQPYTDETLKALPGQGVKSIQILCPGFSADCLETLEEIAEENREYFIQAGGEQYQYIAALNSDQAHIEMMSKIVEQNIQGWHLDNNISQREKLALAQGAQQ